MSLLPMENITCIHGSQKVNTLTVFNCSSAYSIITYSSRAGLQARVWYSKESRSSYFARGVELSVRLRLRVALCCLNKHPNLEIKKHRVSKTPADYLQCYLAPVENYHRNFCGHTWLQLCRIFGSELPMLINTSCCTSTIECPTTVLMFPLAVTTPPLCWSDLLI